MHQRDRNAWRGAAWQREDECYLEVALNFFFDQKEIRSYQQAELQRTGSDGSMCKNGGTSARKVCMQSVSQKKLRPGFSITKKTPSAKLLCDIIKFVGSCHSCTQIWAKIREAIGTFICSQNWRVIAKPPLDESGSGCCTTWWCKMHVQTLRLLN